MGLGLMVFAWCGCVCYDSQVTNGAWVFLQDVDQDALEDYTVEVELELSIGGVRCPSIVVLRRR